MMMMNSWLIIIVVMMFLVPVGCFVAEYFLAKKSPKGGLIFPLVVMCLYFWSGLYTLIYGAILFAIYFVVQYIEKKGPFHKNGGGDDELNKMNIHDL